MADKNLQDVLLESDTPVSYGDSEKPIKDFFINNDSPVVIVKDMYGQAIEAVNLVEFEEYMKNEAAEAEAGQNFNIANDYEILYKRTIGNKTEYHVYQGIYTVGEIDIVKNIQENFSPAKSKTAMKDLPIFFYEHYQLIRLENCLKGKKHNTFVKLSESIKQEKKTLNAHIDGKPFYGLKKVEELQNTVVRRRKCIIFNCVNVDRSLDEGRIREKCDV